MTTFVLLDSHDVVVNVIELESDATYKAPPGLRLSEVGSVVPYIGHKIGDAPASNLTSEQKNAMKKGRLQAIDRASIRALREFVAKLPNAPQQIKDLDQQAQDERGKPA